MKIVDHGIAKENPNEDLQRADLERRGILHRGCGEVRREILHTPPPALPEKVSAVALLLNEREDGR